MIGGSLSSQGLDFFAEQDQLEYVWSVVGAPTFLHKFSPSDSISNLGLIGYMPLTSESCMQAVTKVVVSLRIISPKI